MAKGLKIVGILVLGLVLVTVWWKAQFPSASWRYKITVEVETPEGIKTGSVVRETRASTDIRIGDAGGGAAGTIGEAVVVDLGKRQYLVGLLPEGDDLSLAMGGLPPGTREGMTYYSHLKEGKASLMMKGFLPHFVTFKNPDDPMTVENVDGQDLAKTFGEGVALKDVTIEITDAPVTWGALNTYLPWLEGLKGAYLNGSHLGSKDVPLGLHAGNFQYKGIRK